MAQHALGRLADSSFPGAGLLRLAVVGLAVAFGLASLVPCALSLAPPVVFTKDFLQEYLLARAVAAGVDPYLPMQELADQFLGPLPSPVFDHPTPHPPPVGLLFLPLTLLDYPGAAVTWLALELVCLALAVGLLARANGWRLALSGRLAIATALIAWYPFFWDLGLGQVMVLLLLLLAAARLALLSGRPTLGGVAVGLAILVKPIAWPLLLLFALRREWRTLSASAGTILLGYALAGSAMGFDRVLAYFTQVLPAVNETYRLSSGNQSLWSLGWRLFHGTAIVQAGGLAAPPLIASELAARVLAAAAPALALVLGVRAVRRSLDADLAFGLMICLSILIAPLAWGHYLVLAAIPGAQVIRRLADRRFPSGETNAALLVAALLLLPEDTWGKVAQRIAGQPSDLPFGLALLTFAPALALAALGWLVVSLAAKRETPSAGVLGPPAVRAVPHEC